MVSGSSSMVACNDYSSFAKSAAAEGSPPTARSFSHHDANSVSPALMAHALATTLPRDGHPCQNTNCDRRPKWTGVIDNTSMSCRWGKGIPVHKVKPVAARGGGTDERRGLPA